MSDSPTYEDNYLDNDEPGIPDSPEHVKPTSMTPPPTQFIHPERQYQVPQRFSMPQASSTQRIMKQPPQSTYHNPTIPYRASEQIQQRLPLPLPTMSYRLQTHQQAPPPQPQRPTQRFSNAPQSWEEVEQGAQVLETNPATASVSTEDNMVLVGHFQCTCNKAFKITHPKATTKPWSCKSCGKELWSLESISNEKGKYVENARKINQIAIEGWNQFQNGGRR